MVVLATAALTALVERILYQFMPNWFPRRTRWGFDHWLLLAAIADAVYVLVHFLVPAPTR
jgi:hypothetical protein